MFGMGHWEWILVFLVILLIFGGKKLPEVARGLGKAMREFRKAKDELHEAINREAADPGPDADASEEHPGAGAPPLSEADEDSKK